MIWFCVSLMAVIFTFILTWMFQANVGKVRQAPGATTETWPLSSAAYMTLAGIFMFLTALPAILYKPRDKRR